MLGGADLILDGTDNFETRYLINDYAVSRGIPWIYGAAVGSYGLSMPVIPGRTACLRCVYPDPPAGAQPTCETAGVLNSITAAIAAIQVADALKILCGQGDTVRRRITTIDVWEGTVRQVEQSGARSRMPGVRPARLPLPGCGAARAGQPVRPERRPDSRSARAGPGRDEIAPGEAGGSAGQ